MKPARDNPLDIHCPHCGSTNDRTKGHVNQTLPHKSELGIARRRKCFECNQTWVTYEVNERGYQILARKAMGRGEDGECGEEVALGLGPVGRPSI